MSTMQQIKELREKTGAGIQDVKAALDEAGGDMEKATELLRQKGIATAEKKSGRTAAEGLVSAVISDDRTTGALVEVNCETDFVAKGEAFGALTDKIAAHIAETKPADLEAYLASPAPEGGKTVKEYVTEEGTAKIKENISIRRFAVYSAEGNGIVHSYIHTGGKIGVLIEIGAEKADATSKDEFIQLAKDLSMQIASAAPEFVTRGEIPQSVIDEETRVEMGKDDIKSKPPEIQEKIVTGRVDKLLGQRILLEQPFVKDPGKTVEDVIKEISSSLGDTIQVNRFTRYVLGEGIEKKEENFAEEVMAQIK